MKYKVIGWTYYDNCEVECIDCSEAALNAIIDDIRKNRYIFSGYYHQEGMCGVPVLNDGLARCFSQRSWGGVMARAHGDKSYFGYAAFAFELQNEKTPPENLLYHESGEYENTDLSEDFTYTLSPSDFLSALQGGRVTLPALDCFRYLDKGDRLTLVCGEESKKFLITDFDIRHDISEDDERELFIKIHYGDNEEKAAAEEALRSHPLVLNLKLSPID